MDPELVAIERQLFTERDPEVRRAHQLLPCTAAAACPGPDGGTHPTTAAVWWGCWQFGEFVPAQGCRGGGLVARITGS